MVPGWIETLVPGDDLLPMINAMPVMAPFRSGWAYTNWPYSLAGEVIGPVGGQPWHEVLRQSIWEPLGMARTTTSASWREPDNVAEGFSGLKDGKLHAITSQLVDDSSIMGSAGGVCTSVNELLVYYTALMKALVHTTVDRKLDATSNPFREVQTLLSSHTVLTPAPFGLFSETTYALGLARGRLTGKIGVISDNTRLVDDMPIIGHGTTSQIVLYHSGTLSDFYSSVYLMPETESCVISLVNTKSICDSADWIAQLLVETMLNSEDTHDFIALTAESVKAQSLRYKKASEDLKKGRVRGTKPKWVQSYLGRYYWSCPRYYMDVESAGDGLALVIMGREDQKYELRHYHYDTFTWLMSDDEEMKRGRFIQSTNTYKIVFNLNERDEIDSFTWPEMGGIKGTFSK